MTNENKEKLAEIQRKNPHQSIDMLIERLALAYGRNLNICGKCEDDIRALVGNELAEVCFKEASARSKKYKAKFVGEASAQW